MVLVSGRVGEKSEEEGLTLGVVNPKIGSTSSAGLPLDPLPRVPPVALPVVFSPLIMPRPLIRVKLKVLARPRTRLTAAPASL